MEKGSGQRRYGCWTTTRLNGDLLRDHHNTIIPPLGKRSRACENPEAQPFYCGVPFRTYRGLAHKAITRGTCLRSGADTGWLRTSQTLVRSKPQHQYRQQAAFKSIRRNPRTPKLNGTLTISLCRLASLLFWIHREMMMMMMDRTKAIKNGKRSVFQWLKM